MTRFGLLFLLAVLWLSLDAHNAAACINDRATVGAEREFKSNYIDKKPTPSSESPSGNSPLLVHALTGVGIALLVGTLVVTRWPSRRSPPA